MSPRDNIENKVKQFDVDVNPSRDEEIFNQLQKAMSKPKESKPDIRHEIWSKIMKSNITKVAAAIIIIAALTVIYQITGSIDGASVAWADVVKKTLEVDHLHYYEITNPKDGFPSIREGWYSNGKIKNRSCGGYSSYAAYQSIDNGDTRIQLDRHNNVTFWAKSQLADYDTIFEVLTGGRLSFDYSQFQNTVPSQIGDDFLIYDFKASDDNADWIEKISVTVGRNSLTPIQIKTYYKTTSAQWYGISHVVLFDYEEPPKPEDFFELPTDIKPPHGISQLVLGGEKVQIDLVDAPGIQKAIVRLHTKFDGPAEDLLIPYRERYQMAGGPMYFMEITFITDEGYQSNTMEDCPLWIDRGAKAALGKPEVWPDKKNRNIRFTPVLRTTDQEDVFILELSCWSRIKQTDLN